MPYHLALEEQPVVDDHTYAGIRVGRRQSTRHLLPGTLAVARNTHRPVILFEIDKMSCVVDFSRSLAQRVRNPQCPVP